MISLPSKQRPFLQHGALALFLLLLAAGGGSSRADVIMLIPLRLSAIALLAVTLLSASVEALRAQRWPLLIMAGILVLISLQLMPLPPSIWSSLPGRSFYLEAAAASDLPQPWRPFSISPDLTIEALLGWLPAIALATALLLGPPRYRQWAVPVLLIFALGSVVLAALQQADGPQSSLRLYRYTNPDAGVGLLANRNHQALLMAMAIPAAAHWMFRPGSVISHALVRLLFGATLILLFLLGAFLTGSRTGVILCAVSLLGALAIAWPGLVHAPKKVRTALVVGSLAGVAAVALLVPRERLARSFNETDQRRGIWEATYDAGRAFFPVGSGAGTFERVYPRFERLEELKPEYANKAHNDFLEIGLEAGVVAYLLLAAFLAWYTVSAIKVWRGGIRPRPGMALGRLMSILLFGTALASITDYPARTPLIGSFALAAAILLRYAANGRAGADQADGDPLPSAQRRRSPVYPAPTRR